MTKKVYCVLSFKASLLLLVSKPLKTYFKRLLLLADWDDQQGLSHPSNPCEPKRAPEKDLRRKDFLGKGATDRKVLPITFSNRLTKNRVATHSHLNLYY